MRRTLTTTNKTALGSAQVFADVHLMNVNRHVLGKPRLKLLEVIESIWVVSHQRQRDLQLDKLVESTSSQRTYRMDTDMAERTLTA